MGHTIRDHKAWWLPSLLAVSIMTVDHHEDSITGSKPAWAEVWHFWSVIVPRRSITGRLVFGQIWRRHDGRRWIYKKFVAHAD
jgi:hypothetical protein